MEPIQLAGFVTIHDLYPLLCEMFRTSRLQPGTRFVLDCAAVTGFSCRALAELVKLRRDLRGDGCELKLAHCGREVATGLAQALFLDLVADRPARRDSEFAKRKEPYFLRLHGTRYQRFWMN